MENGDFSEAFVQEIQNRINAFIADEDGGIPKLRRRMEERGIASNITVSVSLARDNTAEILKQAGIDIAALRRELGQDAEAAEGMGLTAKDIEEIRQFRFDSVKNLVVAGIRERAPKLSPRIRNWMRGYISNTFSGLAVDLSDRFSLADDALWLAKTEEVIAAALPLENNFEILAGILGNMMRLGRTQ